MCVYRIHSPFFFSPSYQKKLDNELKAKNQLIRSELEYGELINLRRHLSRMAESIHQLKGIRNEGGKWDKFEEKVAALVETKFENKKTEDKKRNECRNIFNDLKSEFEDNNTLMKAGSVCFLVSDSLLTLSAGVGVVVGAAAMATGPVGLVCFGIGLAVVASAILLLATYSMYVEGRFLAGKQFKEIENALDELAPSSGSAPECDDAYSDTQLMYNN